MQAEEAFKSKLSKCVESSVVPDGRIDLVDALLMPPVMAMMSELSGVSSSLSDVPTISQIFDARMSLNRRKSIEYRLREIFDEASGRMTSEEATLAVAIFMVGADSILASMSVSLYHDLKKSLGRRLSEVDWSPAFPKTGVPYVDRIATEDMEVCGISISSGDRLRLRLDTFDAPYEGDTSGHFGFARHTCLGKALSISAWQALTEELSRIGKGYSNLEATQRRPDFLFNSLQSLEVTFHD
ncbi:hypothetical protein SAMN05877809_11512 [Rhodobacter sp. JA431]|nr:hypothetical protein SAMN05877809_11512 [Rhodobacter sp. JA431]